MTFWELSGRLVRLTAIKRTSQFFIVTAATLALALTVTAPAIAQQAEPDQVDAPKLQSLLVGMGFEVKVMSEKVGEQNYEVIHKTDKYNVPVGYSISTSGRYVWLTCSLGDNSSSKKHEALLKANAAIQPVHFYITTKNKLMCGFALENRGVNAAALKRATDLVVKAVTGQDSAWL